MDFAEFKGKTATTNQLAQVDTLGSFDFFTAIVSLESLQEKDIDEIADIPLERSPKWQGITDDLYYKLAKVLPLAAHEYTHFLDSTSTIWGLNHLALMNSAYLSNSDLGGTEEEFYKAKAFYDHTISIHLPKYFTVINSDVDNSRPWQSTITVGKRFAADGRYSQKPVLFSQFINAKEEFLARSPISTVSILEASAMAQEVLLQSTLLSLTYDEFRNVESQIYSRRLINNLYNSSITEYSVCVHMIANQQKCKDVSAALRLCGALCRVVLNATRELYEVAAESGAIEQVLGFESASESYERLRQGLIHEDMGVLFYLLCGALPENTFRDIGSLNRGINHAIEKVGFNMERWEASRRKYAKDKIQMLSSSRIKPIAKLAQAGYLNHQVLRPLSTRINFVDFSTPPALLGDSKSVHIFRSDDNRLRDFDLEACFNELYKGQSWVTRFSEACVG